MYACWESTSPQIENPKSSYKIFSRIYRECSAVWWMICLCFLLVNSIARQWQVKCKTRVVVTYRSVAWLLFCFWVLSTRDQYDVVVFTILDDEKETVQGASALPRRSQYSQSRTESISICKAREEGHWSKRCIFSSARMIIRNLFRSWWRSICIKNYQT